MKKKISVFLSLIQCIVITNCTSAKQYKDGVLIVHPYIVINGTRFSEDVEVPAKEGDDISSKICFCYKQDDPNEIINHPVKIYTDEDEKHVFETSKLYSFDSSIKELYIKCERLQDIDLDSFFSGEYTNIYSDKLVVNNDQMSGKLLESFSFKNSYARRKKEQTLYAYDLHTYDGEEEFVSEKDALGNSIIYKPYVYYDDHQSYKQDINYQCLVLEHILNPIAEYLVKNGKERESIGYYLPYVTFYRHNPITA